MFNKHFFYLSDLLITEKNNLDRELLNLHELNFYQLYYALILSISNKVFVVNVI